MHTQEIKFNNHKFKVSLRDQVDQSVLAEIFQERVYRSAEEIIKSAKYPIIDAGSQAGFFTLYCRALNDKITIYAVEPEPANIKMLVKHVKDNHLTSVKVIEKALAGQNGRRSFYLSEDNHNHSLITETMTIISADCLSLTDFFQEFKLAKISLLKMDIEGAEYEVLQNLKAEDWLKMETIILEYHDLPGLNHRTLMDLIRQNGFSLESFASHYDKSMGFILARNKRIK